MVERSPAESVDSGGGARPPVGTVLIPPITVDIAALVIVILVASLIRLYKIDISYWYDETLTHEGASLPLTEVFTHRFNFLYYLFSHFALRIEDSEYMLRLPSLVMGIAALVAIYGFTREAAGRSPAIFALVLLALSVDHVHWSQEARFYAAVTLASVLMTWTLWRCIQHNGWRNWTAFVLSAVLGVGSQLTVVPYLVVLLGTAAVWIAFAPASGIGMPRWQRLGVMALCSILSLSVPIISAVFQGGLPESPIVLDEGYEEDLTDSGGAAEEEPVWVYRLTAGRYARFLTGFLPGDSLLLRMLSMSFLVVGAGFLIRKAPVLASLIAAQFFLAPIPYFVVPVNHFYRDRYFASLMPFYPVLIAIGIWLVIDCLASVGRRNEARSPRRRALTYGMSISIIAVIGLTAVPQLRDYFSSIPPRDWRAAGEYLAHTVQHGDVIVCTRPSWKPDVDVSNEVKAGLGCPSLEFYLRRGLMRARADSSGALLNSLSLIEASSPDQIKAASRIGTRGAFHFVTVNEPKAARQVRRTLANLPAVDTVNVNGITVRTIHAP